MSTPICTFCKSPILSKYSTKFCGKSCSAKYNNSIRKPRSKESKQKTAKSLKDNYQEFYPKFSKIHYLICTCCSKQFFHKSIIKFCSDSCRNNFASKRQSKRLSSDPDYRKNLGRKSMSYMEKSFSEWLDSYDIDYEQEKQFKNHDLNKYYYADFYFSSLSLVIELDGSQHAKTLEKDKIRDSYIKSYYGIDVIRITHKEYKNKSKIQMIISILDL